jgi:hypothetical protein
MEEEIRSDIVDEAARVSAAAIAADVPVRLIGGLAIRLHTRNELPVALARDYQDIDLVTTSKGGKRTLKLLAELGYTGNDRFNAINAGHRAVVYDMAHGRQVDVFIGEFEMCHKLDLASRLGVDTQTVPLAELLLTKLQVVRLNRKDLVDIVTLLYEHDVGDHDDDTINAALIARLLSSDWGLWRTSRGTIETAQARLADLKLDPAGEQRVRERLERLWRYIEDEPKSLRWRSRARIGDRARWYEEPEEIDHDRTGERL